MKETKIDSEPGKSILKMLDDSISETRNSLCITFTTLIYPLIEQTPENTEMLVASIVETFDSMIKIHELGGEIQTRVTCATAVEKIELESRKVELETLKEEAHRDLEDLMENFHFSTTDKESVFSREAELNEYARLRGVFAVGIEIYKPDEL